MFSLLLFVLGLFVVVSMFVLLIPTLCYLITLGFNKIFRRDKTMDTEPHDDNQVRVLTLENDNFQDETLYRMKKG